MRLVSAWITKFRSIDDSGEFQIDPGVTILVGQNEAGKSAVLQALFKSDPVEEAGYDVTLDYPRKHLNQYRPTHETSPAQVLQVTYALDPDEIAAINKDLGYTAYSEHTHVTLSHNYKNSFSVGLHFNEKALVDHLAATSPLSSDASGRFKAAPNVRKAITAIPADSMTEGDRDTLAEIGKRFPESKGWSDSPGALYVWQQHIRPHLPQFLYFDDYRLLEGKINLNELNSRISNKQLQDSDRTAISLLNMAGVSPEDFSNPEGYEDIKAKLEGLSNSITDRIFKYWKQNQELDVEFDIREDPKDLPPFNNGRNLYIRIRNRRHRVTVPFSQRSKGFIWFFSFIVWFDSVKRSHEATKPLVLLLDEPGLSLHALAQSDFLDYIEDLSANHQVIYTTHSPFMVPSDHLERVRVVEDRKDTGTRVSDNLSRSDAKTLFPLQAALGYTIAQNLFISERNLLVEGPGDLIALRHMSERLLSLSRTGLRADTTVVPVGGLDKVATFVALLGANALKIVVLHDFAGRPEQRIQDLIKDKLITDRAVLNYASFRGVAPAVPTDIEDLFEPSEYLDLFNAAYTDKLGSREVRESDLKQGDRIVQRVEHWLVDNSVQVRPSGGFNHYLPLQQLLFNPSRQFSPPTLDRFERVLTAVNNLL